MVSKNQKEIADKFEKNNPDELFEKLSTLLNNLEKANEMGKKGKRINVCQI